MAHWQHVIFGDESRFKLYLVDGRLRVCRLPGERFQQRCQAQRVQAGGASVHIWGAFHSGTKSPHVLPKWYLISDLALQWHCAKHLPNSIWGRDNYRYQNSNATPHHARVVLDFLLAGQCHHDEAASKIARLQPHRTYLWWIGPCNPQYGQTAQNMMSSTKPCWING